MRCGDVDGVDDDDIDDDVCVWYAKFAKQNLV